MRRRVAITGLGAVTPVGNDAETTWQSLVAGQSGVGPITTFDARSFPVRIAGLVKGFDRRLAPAVARPATFPAQAVSRSRRRRRRSKNAGLDGEYEPHERALSLGAEHGPTSSWRSSWTCPA